jgi:hypothetical protein
VTVVGRWLLHWGDGDDSEPLELIEGGRAIWNGSEMSWAVRAGLRLLIGDALPVVPLAEFEIADLASGRLHGWIYLFWATDPFRDELEAPIMHLATIERASDQEPRR